MRIGSFVAQENRRLGAEGINICGVLVHAHPDRREQVGAALDGVEVHQAEADGRMVVVVEDTPEEWAGQIITRIPTIDGVLSASLIYELYRGLIHLPVVREVGYPAPPYFYGPLVCRRSSPRRHSALHGKAPLLRPGAL